MTRLVPALCLAAALAACGGADPDPDDVDDPPDAMAAADAPPTSPDAAPACGGADLCTRTIEECDVNITMDSCLAFYDPATTTCADIAGYTACNCACIDEPTCDGYFDCGTLCFEDWC